MLSVRDSYLFGVLCENTIESLSLEPFSVVCLMMGSAIPTHYTTYTIVTDRQTDGHVAVAYTR